MNLNSYSIYKNKNEYKEKIISKNRKMEEYKYNCEKCNFRCNILSRWEKHINTELHLTGKKKIRSDYKGFRKCDHCDYSTEVLITLKLHYLNHHASKEERKKEFKYYCETCDIGAFAEEIFKKHQNSTKHKYLKIANI